MKQIVLILAIAAMFSCTGKSTNAEAVKTEVREPERDPVEKMIYDNTKEFNKGLRIKYLKKINMGIPGGENWLVKWDRIENVDNISYSILAVYCISGNTFKDYGIIQLSDKNRFGFDIMKDIPGQRISDLNAAFGDYNQDGYDEIFAIWGSGVEQDTFYIHGYDGEKDAIEIYKECDFGIKDDLTGPPPVKFLTYEGIDGIQVLLPDGQYIFTFWSKRFLDYTDWDGNEPYVPQE